jgi:chromosome segregation ATPase
MELSKCQNEEQESQRSRNTLLEDLKEAEAQASRAASLEVDLQESQTRVAELVATVLTLKEEIESAAAAADEQHWRSEDALAALRDDVEHSRNQAENLSRELETSKAEVTEVIRAKNVLLEDLDAANEKIDDLQRSHEKAMESQQAQTGEKEGDKTQIEELTQAINVSKSQASGSLRAQNAVLEDLTNANAKIETMIVELEDSKSLLALAKAQTEEVAAISKVWQKENHFVNERIKELESESTSVRQLCDEKENEIHSTNALCKQQQERIDGAVSQFHELESQINNLQTEKQMLQQDGDRRFDSACAHLNEMENQVHQLESEIISLESERDDLTQQVTTQEQRLDGALSQLNDMEGALLACQEEVETSELHVKALGGKLQAVSAEKRSYQNQSIARSMAENEFKEDLEKLKGERDTINTELAERDKKLLATETLVSNISTREEELVAKNRDLFSRIEILETTVEMLETAKDGLEGQMSAIESKMHGSLGDFESTKEELQTQLIQLDNESFRREITSISADLAETSERESMLRTEVEKAREQMVRKVESTKMEKDQQTRQFESNLSQVKQQVKIAGPAKDPSSLVTVKLEQLLQLMIVFVECSNRACFHGHYLLRLSDFYKDKVESTESQLATALDDSRKLQAKIKDVESKLDAKQVEFEKALAIRDDARWLSKDLADQITKLQGNY